MTDDETLENALAAVRSLREYRAGSAFDVPGTAVESFCRAVLSAGAPVFTADLDRARDIAVALEQQLAEIGEYADALIEHNGDAAQVHPVGASVAVSIGQRLQRFLNPDLP